MKKCQKIFEPCDTPDLRIVDLASCEIPFLPVFADTHHRNEFLSIGPHRHPGYLEVLFCRQGENMTYDSDGRELSFRMGDVCVAQPEKKHYLKSYPKGLKYYWFWLKLSAARTQFPHLSPKESRTLQRRLRELPAHFTADDRVRRAFRTVWESIDRLDDDPLKKVQVRLAVYELLISLTEAAYKPSREEQIPKSFDALLTEMREHPERTYPLEKLEARVGVHGVLLNHLFKRATGLPPHAYLTSLRIARAKEMLKKGKLNISQIAHALGYPSGEYFATQFRRETGTTPRAWRKL